MALNWKFPFRNHNETILVTLLGIATIFLTGCNYSYETTKQGYWDRDHLRASIVESLFRSYGAPLLVTEQLITLIREPDYKMTPAVFEERIPKDKPSIMGEWHMQEVWYSYRRCKGERRDSSEVVTAETWRVSPEFNKCLLWVYDESLHFKKPLHSGNWLRTLCCGKPKFSVNIFFVEDSQVVGSHSIGSTKPFFMKEK